MTLKKNIVAVVGSASTLSANLLLVKIVQKLTSEVFDISIFNELKTLPHFDPELSTDNPPAAIMAFRKMIEAADGVLICTPEYVFSLPSGLKNALEWCIATTIFTNKPCGLITASASGQKGHEALQLIMQTAMARFTDDTCLLIQGIKGKIDESGRLSDCTTMERLVHFLDAFKELVKEG